MWFGLDLGECVETWLETTADRVAPRQFPNLVPPFLPTVDSPLSCISVKTPAFSKRHLTVSPSPQLSISVIAKL